MLETAFTRLVGCSVPIQLSGMGSILGPELAAAVSHVVHTTRFEVDCPMCPSVHSVLRSALEAAEALPDRSMAEVEIAGERFPIFPFQGLPLPSKEVRGRIDAMACSAGQSVGDVRRVQPAAEIVAELADGAETLLARSAAQVAQK